MFKNYKDIFNQRGTLYHQGMLKYPLARAAEFNNIIKLSDLQDNQIICDMPSGGCYISNFIQQNLKIISIETSNEFIKDSHNTVNNTIVVCEDISNIPLNSNSIDRIMSLAGLHHIEHKVDFYKEAYRLLKTKGIFCIADALKDSKVANFLNIFVDQYNSMGHQGNFLTENTKDELEFINFQVVHNDSISYHWCFDSVASMVDYCQLLFGIDQANYNQILEGIETYLGYYLENDKCYMNWELHFLKSIKDN
ncbi:class I SAM-dependent methyltransferase [Okeania hirsuta]|uniref:class I SAM-dependent methyltransferase n=1 Tax=Okeania hirsuta TaxID=1458930 RepID=UPI000F52AE38|nr:class I SAM-dependent methyltransferase [Okeania hirsuta]RQH16602.1 methyltransferase domain-containing protein [Okeania hirsuta]